MLNKTLRLVMNNSPISSATDDSILDAAKKMHKSNIGAVVITDKNKIVGIFTERDLVRLCAQGEYDFKNTPLKKVMTKKVTKVDQDTALEDALMILSTNNFRHLPVVDDDKLVGILSLKDICGEVLEKILKAHL